MNKDQQAQIQNKIDAIAINTEFDIKTLMGDEWSAVTNKQTFGIQFKDAIAKGDITGLKHERLDNSPRRDIYKKTQ